MLPIHALYYFVEVDKYQSISLAAEALHVTQPTLTVALKKLEQQLGKPLMTRTYKGMITTSYGKEVVELAKKAISYLDQIEESAYRNDVLDSFSLHNTTIYCNPYYSGFIASCFAELIAQGWDGTFPDVRNIASGETFQDLLMRESGSVFFGIVPESMLTDFPFPVVTLKKSNCFIMYNAKAFPALKNQTSVSFQDILHLPLVSVQEKHVFAESLFSKLQKYGTPHIVATAPDASSCSAMVQRGIGVGFTNHFTESNGVDILPIRQSPVFSLILAYNAAIAADSVATLAEMLRAHL